MREFDAQTIAAVIIGAISGIIALYYQDHTGETWYECNALLFTLMVVVAVISFVTSGV